MDIYSDQKGKRDVFLRLMAVPEILNPVFIHKMEKESFPKGSILFEKARFFGIYGRRLFSNESLVDPLEKNDKNSSGHDGQKAVDQKDTHMGEAIVFFLS